MVISKSAEVKALEEKEEQSGCRGLKEESFDSGVKNLRK